MSSFLFALRGIPLRLCMKKLAPTLKGENKEEQLLNRQLANENEYHKKYILITIIIKI